ncbi:DNA-binding transcriptional LysR family regulator [Novosphingobium sp. SG751A]|uniref:LysR family transcriptional regulator n=1 Tax=Novosphingobium sp. SG751A TaxID=2587000 RepID=UPI0015569A54|nr:LysR family transcriptional regulator [Novosphingobium sp. SG751A]NOW47771.1 DNA-binding transcriptional LysR family regulator [Novosphingobium sp. SG751A]
MTFSEREMQCFVAVAETGSLGRAAAHVHLAQPSLSRLVQRMEAQSGQPLFDRTTRGMVLTDAGDVLFRHARHMLADMENLRDELAALRGLRRGVVRVGAVAAVMRGLVVRASAQMLELCPGLRIEAREDVNSVLLQALEQRELDIVLTAGEVGDEAVRCVGCCDYSDSFAVFCAQNHPISAKPSLDELFACQWVMPGPAFSPRVRFEVLARPLGYAVSVGMETNSVETMATMCAASRLLSWLPVPLMKARVDEGVVRRLEVPALELRRHFWVYCRNRGLLSEAAREFLRHLPLCGGPGADCVNLF